jgi:hypothetical protein
LSGYLRCLHSHPQLAEEAQKSVKGMNETAIHAKYIELARHSVVIKRSFIATDTSHRIVRRAQANGA